MFVNADEETKLVQVLKLSNRMLAFLRERGQATRNQISAECFRDKVPKALLDASLKYLLAATSPNITAQRGERADSAPGAPLRGCRLVVG